jgi:hypothetical protein
MQRAVEKPRVRFEIVRLLDRKGARQSGMKFQCHIKMY